MDNIAAEVDMKNAVSIKRRLDEVKENKNYTQALSVLADILYEVGMQACTDRASLQRDIRVLQKIILGNGSPENSVIARLASVEECAKKVSEGIEEIKESLEGGFKHEGLIERLRNIEKDTKVAKRIMWLVVAIVIGEVVLKLIGLL